MAIKIGEVFKAIMFQALVIVINIVLPYTKAKKNKKTTYEPFLNGHLVSWKTIGLSIIVLKTIILCNEILHCVYFL